jgi:restriction system protein
MVPTYQEFYAPVLNAMKDGDTYNRHQVAEKVATILELTDAEKAEKISSGENTFINRAGWAMTYLKQAGALGSPKRSQWKITERGIYLLQNHPDGFENEQLMQFEEFLLFRERRGTRSGHSSEGEQVSLVLAETGSVDELIDAAVDNNIATISADLVKKLETYNPYAFEELQARRVDARVRKCARGDSDVLM